MSQTQKILKPTGFKLNGILSSKCQPLLNIIDGLATLVKYCFCYTFFTVAKSKMYWQRVERIALGL